jgi:hypothetical protein
MARLRPAKQKTNNGANVGYEARLWQMADTLRKIKYAAVDKYAVLRLIFPVQPATALARFHPFAQGSYGRIDELENESRTLAALRDTLLPKLLSGQLRISRGERLSTEANL